MKNKPYQDTVSNLPDSKEGRITKEQIKLVIVDELEGYLGKGNLTNDKLVNLFLEKASIRVLNLFR